MICWMWHWHHTCTITPFTTVSISISVEYGTDMKNGTFLYLSQDFMITIMILLFHMNVGYPVLPVAISNMRLIWMKWCLILSVSHTFDLAAMTQTVHVTLYVYDPDLTHLLCVTWLALLLLDNLSISFDQLQSFINSDWLLISVLNCSVHLLDYFLSLGVSSIYC